MKQNFVCIGAQKAGTTTLADILSAHTDICIPPVKETKFFLFADDYAKGSEFYNAYFSNFAGQKAIGEFDPDYLLFPETAQRIADTLGKDIRILVVLRNPADRAYSHYLMTRRKGLEPLEFSGALEAESSRKGDIKQRKIFAYLERGMYGDHLEKYLSVFPASQFMFVLFETDLLQNKAMTIARIQEFLQVPVQALNLDVHSNEAGEPVNEQWNDLLRKQSVWKKLLRFILPVKSIRRSMRKSMIKKNMQKAATPRLSEAERGRLIRKYFIDDIHKTELLTGLDLSVWYK